MFQIHQFAVGHFVAFRQLTIRVVAEGGHLLKDRLDLFFLSGDSSALRSTEHLHFRIHNVTSIFQFLLVLDEDVVDFRFGGVEIRLELFFLRLPAFDGVFQTNETATNLMEDASDVPLYHFHVRIFACTAYSSLTMTAMNQFGLKRLAERAKRQLRRRGSE